MQSSPRGCRGDCCRCGRIAPLDTGSRRQELNVAEVENEGQHAPALSSLGVLHQASARPINRLQISAVEAFGDYRAFFSRNGDAVLDCLGRRQF